MRVEKPLKRTFFKTKLSNVVGMRDVGISQKFVPKNSSARSIECSFLVIRQGIRHYLPHACPRATHGRKSHHFPVFRRGKSRFSEATEKPRHTLDFLGCCFLPLCRHWRLFPCSVSQRSSPHFGIVSGGEIHGELQSVGWIQIPGKSPSGERSGVEGRRGASDGFLAPGRSPAHCRDDPSQPCPNLFYQGSKL